LRLTRSEGAPSWERANIFPATLNTEVLGPNGNVSSAPVNERQESRSSAGFTARFGRCSSRGHLDQSPKRGEVPFDVHGPSGDRAVETGGIEE
jgi:hypothetical protein